MGCVLKHVQWIWPILGLVVGLSFSGLWPHTPLHAVATDRTENAVLCTVPVDQGVEAVFYLDSLTGWIRGAVPSRQVEGAFQATWQHNVNVDLTAFVTRMNAGIKSAGKAAGRPEMQLPQNPKYMVTSGLIDYPTRATLRPASSVLYVAEASTGVVLCYAIPWNSSAHISNQPWAGDLKLWSCATFATAIVRNDE
ncbi:MAG: hypothetical protein ACLQNE_25750 [Thermoguttaceae bacterium]